MDELLGEFLTETNESLDLIDVQLVEFEREPNQADTLSNIFRLVHTVKGTCGFLGLPRLAALAHAAETLMGRYRDGAPVTPEGVTAILHSIDRIKELMAELEAAGVEPEGADTDLIAELERISVGAESQAEEPPQEAPAEEPPAQTLERDLKPGEVSLDELERAFQEAPGPDDVEEPAASKPEAPQPAPKPSQPAEQAKPAAADPGRAAPAGEGVVKAQSIRVNVDTLEHLMTTVSELVLTRNQLLEMVRQLDDSEFKVPLQRLSNVTAELQEGVMKTRMQPIGNAWQKLPRIVRDLAKDLGKDILLEMNGADTELDRQVLELIKDPLTHMVRNSADHGLEATEDRIAAGKPEAGTIALSAYHEGGHIIISIADDGRGLNVEKIRTKVLQNGLATEAELEKMTEAQINRFIFGAGFSTATQVSNVSGRGVGMDVVRTNIELIGGSVDVKSTVGKGSTFTIKIPLTLAIVSALIVEAESQRFAIPQLSVIELVRASAKGEHRIEMINKTPVLRLRNKLLPLVGLSELLGLATDADGSLQVGGASPADEAPDEVGAQDAEAMDDPISPADQNNFVVVTQVGAQTFGIVVDGVFHTEEIVVKPMSSMLRDITLFSGNTILGDGSVIMIIDPNGIAQSAAASIASAVEETACEADEDETSEDEATALLLFRAGGDEPKAVPLSLVTRLEEIPADKIERTNGRDVVQYRGALMPLAYIGDPPPLRSDGVQPVLVFSNQSHCFGLAVDEIVDIVKEVLNIEVATEQPGRIGSAVIKGKARELVDIGHFLGQVFEDWGPGTEEETDDNQRLLLVDDSAFFRNMLTPLLKASGYSVTVADSAERALSLKSTGRVFDVIVSDIEMPGMNGFELAEALARDETWSATPIIALSSHSTPDYIERGRRAGFRDYVAKFDREGLMSSLKECSLGWGKAA